MKTNPDLLLPKYSSIAKKAVNGFYYLRTVFLPALVFALCVFASAQAVDYNLPQNRRFSAEY